MGAAAARRDKRCDGARSGAAPDPKGPTMLHRRLTGLAVTAGLLAFAAPASAAPPGNDNFENAAPLGQPVAQVTGTVDQATRQEGEPVHGLQTVWYAFQPSTTQRVAARSSGAWCPSASWPRGPRAHARAPPGPTGADRRDPRTQWR